MDEFNSLSTAKAVSAFKRLLRKAPQGKNPGDIQQVWQLFRQFCLMEIDCSGAAALFEVGHDKYSPHPQPPFYVSMTRYWYKPGVVSDTAYLASCQFYFVSDPTVANLQFTIEHGCMEPAEANEFIALVEGHTALWIWLAAQNSIRFETYVGPR